MTTAVLSIPAPQIEGANFLNLLIVDDERAIREVCREVAQSLEFNTVVADSTEHAYRALETVESDMVVEHIGTAIPVHVNFAISVMDRVVRDLRAALHRHKREVPLVRQEVQQALRNELKDTVSAVLLSCEMALQVPNLPDAAAIKMRSACELAQEVRVKLDGA